MSCCCIRLPVRFARAHFVALRFLACLDRHISLHCFRLPVCIARALFFALVCCFVQSDFCEPSSCVGIHVVQLNIISLLSLLVAFVGLWLGVIVFLILCTSTDFTARVRRLSSGDVVCTTTFANFCNSRSVCFSNQLRDGSLTTDIRHWVIVVSLSTSDLKPLVGHIFLAFQGLAL